MNPSGHGPVAGCCEYGNEPFWFNKMRGICWLAKRLLVSQERLHSLELFWWHFALWDSAFKLCLSSAARQDVWRFELLFKPGGTTLFLRIAARCASWVPHAVLHEQYRAVYRLRTDPFLLIFYVARKSTLCCPLSCSNRTDLSTVTFK